MAADTAPRKRTTWKNAAIFFAIYLFFQIVLPAPEPITKAGMGVLGFFFGTLYLWISVEIGWPSIFVLGLICLMGVTTPTTLFSKTWGNSMVPFLICAFLLNMVLADTGLSRRFALFFITRKRNRGRPWRLLTMFFLAVLLMGLVSTSSAITVMFMAIAEEIFRMTGYKKGDRLVEAMMIGIFWVAQGAMAYTPISHVLIPMIFEYIAADFGITITYTRYTLAFSLAGLGFFIGWMLILRFIIRPDVDKLKDLNIDELKASLKPWTKQEVTALVVYLAVIIMWCFPDVIGLVPSLQGVSKWMGSLGSAVPAMLAVGVLSLIEYDGKPMLDVKRLPWGNVFMMATVMGMGFVFGLDTVGISAWIMKVVSPVMSGLSPHLFVLAVIAFITILTDFVSNTLSASMYAVIVPIALTVPGVNPIVVALLIAAGCNSSFTFPSGCPAASLASGGGWTRVSFQIKYGCIVNTWAIIMYFTLAYPLLMKLFPY